MKNRISASQDGLALLGSMLLVSMLAVLSTAFLLVMAADVRIAQSHYRNTQAACTAESALEVAGYYLSQGSSLPLTWSSGSDTFSVTEVVPQPAGYPSYKRLIQVTAFSGRASYDIYTDILSPRQDPRAYFAIAAGTVLELYNGCAVIGGGLCEGVYMSGSNPRIQNNFGFYSPDSTQAVMWVGGDITWGDAGYLHTYWDGKLDIRTGLRLLAGPDTSLSLVPAILLSESSVPKIGYPRGGQAFQYRVTGSASIYYAEWLPDNIPSHSGTYAYPSTPASQSLTNNPMGICVWTYGGNTGDFLGDITINGTLYCTNMYSDLRIREGNFTIIPKIHTNGEKYPALVSKGDVIVDRWGTRNFYGLVYVRDDFRSDPSANQVFIDGALVANRIHLLARTVVHYNADIYNRVPAPVLAIAHPTAVLQSRRYVYSLWGF
jgi:hypothetical protein